MSDRKRESDEAYRAEAIILPEGETRRASPDESISLDGKRVIGVQTNLGLGMYVTGQALITGLLTEKYHRPASLESVAVVPRDDVVIRSFFEEHPDGWRTSHQSPVFPRASRRHGLRRMCRS